MQVKEASRTLHPEPCFLNHEAHEEKAKNEHTKKETKTPTLASCFVVGFYSFEEPSCIVHHVSCILPFSISHSSFIRFGVGRW